MKRSGLAVVLLVLVSCGSSDGPPPVNDAPEKCSALVTHACLRLRECLPGVATQAECEAGLKTDLPCALAVGTGPGYASCIAEIDSSPCTILYGGGMLHSPASCTGVILVPPP